MPRHCTVCDHPAIEAVERDLRDSRLTLDEISWHYSLSRSALCRHRTKCMMRREGEALAARMEAIARRFGASVEDVWYHYEHCLGGGGGHACDCGQKPCAKEPPAPGQGESAQDL